MPRAHIYTRTAEPPESFNHLDNSSPDAARRAHGLINSLERAKHEFGLAPPVRRPRLREARGLRARAATQRFLIGTTCMAQWRDMSLDELVFRSSLKSFILNPLFAVCVLSRSCIMARSGGLSSK